MESRSRLKIALACYAALGIVAGLALEGKFRIAIWIFLAGLTVKTLIASKQIDR